MAAGVGAADDDFLCAERSRCGMKILDSVDIERPGNVFEEDLQERSRQEDGDGTSFAKPWAAEEGTVHSRGVHSSMRTISGDHAITQSPP